MARPSKDFEAICLERMKLEEERGEATMSRYGVTSSFFPDKETGALTWQPVQSLPDFEGLVAEPRGRQFVTDAKYTANSSVELRASHFPERQLGHMYRRSRFGAVCFLLIHFAARELKTCSYEAETWAFPVWPDHPFWIAFEAGQVSSINRSTAATFGVPVPWNRIDGGRKPRPDVLAGVIGIMELFDRHPTNVYPAVDADPRAARRERRRAAAAADVDSGAVQPF